ncbi:MAG: lipopolysaccharide biosynthesis protein [Lachnospiraceae bacterium]
MEVLRRLIINDKPETLERQNMVWNMAGSFLYAFASMVLTMAVIQLVGDEQGGVFTFAFTTFGQQMFMVAYFGIRPFQSTDVEGQYTFGDYLRLRKLTCGVALAMGVGYVLMKGYTPQTGMVILLMVCYKVIDGYADVYEAEFQRLGRLYLTGKSNAFRTILSVGSFLTALAVTRQLVFSCMVAVTAQLLGLLLFDIVIMGGLPEVRRSRSENGSRRLAKCCLLLFLSVFLDFYIFSASKYAIENHMTDSAMAVYGAIFMPTSVINLVAGFVIRPYLTTLSLRWERKEFDRFWDVVKRIFLVILGLTCLAVGGAAILGIPVLSILYSNIREQLASCRLPLVMIILGGGFNALMNLFYYALVIMKHQKVIFGSYVLVCVAAMAISPVCVKNWGILGGSVSYLILMALLALCFGISAGACYKKAKEA